MLRWDWHTPPEAFPWKKTLLAVVAVLAIASVAVSWWWPRPEISKVSYQPAHTAAAVSGIPKQAVSVPAGVKVYRKKQAVQKLDLPEDVATDDRQQITAAVQIPATKGGATAVTVIDTETGESRVLVKEQPRNLLGIETGNELGLRYGLSTKGSQQAAIYYRRDLARVGDIYIAGYLEGSADVSAAPRPEGRAAIDISYRW